MSEDDDFFEDEDDFFEEPAITDIGFVEEIMEPQEEYEQTPENGIYIENGITFIVHEGDIVFRTSDPHLAEYLTVLRDFANSGYQSVIDELLARADAENEGKIMSFSDRVARERLEDFLKRHRHDIA
jgi:hypothetical protein